MSQTDITEELDRLSLAQALQDVEIANARVMDLTQRLIAASKEVADLRREIDEFRAEHHELHEKYVAMEGSSAYRLSTRLVALREMLRR